MDTATIAFAHTCMNMRGIDSDLQLYLVPGSPGKILNCLVCTIHFATPEACGNPIEEHANRGMGYKNFELNEPE